MISVLVPGCWSPESNANFGGEISIRHGETLQIVNDDGDLLHHAYIDSPKLAFDSGDQQPGTRTDITFATPGDFEVLCAIHPKMRLVVHVN